MRKYLWLCLLGLVLAPASAKAQSVGLPTSKVDFASAYTLTESSAGTYQMELDAAAPVTVTVTCVAGAPVRCSFPFPGGITPGAHTLKVNQRVTVSGLTFTTPYSAAFAFTIVGNQGPTDIKLIAN
jgi:hypothetical protein